MVLLKILFSFLVLLRKVHGDFQINLHVTDWKNENKDLQHDCLYVMSFLQRLDTAGLITSYCMSEWPSKWKIEENDSDQKLTFEDLLKRGITSDQLYRWSASIDTIENYQLYLDKKLNSENVSMVFYNCTFPYFGPKCQFTLNNDKKSYYSSLDEFVHSYYDQNRYVPSTLTCYMHLQCDRGPSPSCLDWTEICDGKTDCLDGEQDEENCWLLEIERSNRKMHVGYPDESDGFHYQDKFKDYASTVEPTILSEDISCAYRLTLTSSCVTERNKLILQAIFSIKPNSLSNECWTALKCMINVPTKSSLIEYLLCFDEITIDEIKQTCPDIIYTTAVPIFFGHIYFVYEKSKLNYNWNERYNSMYISYDHRKLQLLDDGNNILVSINRTHRLYIHSTFPNDYPHLGVLDTYIPPLRQWLFMSTILISNNSIHCNRSHMYQCMNSSKCISQTRLLDGIRDCYLNDDEAKEYFNGNCSPKLNYEILECPFTNSCIAKKFLDDLECDCPKDNYGYCNDEFVEYHDLKYTILFRRMCDKFTGLLPIIIDGQKYTDETECEQWPCNNFYSRCDGILTCSNGIDEVNCHSPSLINCSSNNHICLSSQTSQMTCLSLEQFNDNHIDCIGAIDETRLCPADGYENIFQKFHCQLINSSRSCLEGTYKTYKSNISKLFCPIYYQNVALLSKQYFKEFITDKPQPTDEVVQEIEYYQSRCHRGLDVQVSLDKTRNRTTNTCLCPPSFYGDTCQYQNQRVTIVLQIFTRPDVLQTSFIISLSLIDDSIERTIHSNEQIMFLAKKFCRTKFYIYLLYSNRPKNSTKHYSIQIDIYDRKTLVYRGSILKSILFSFLPVYRLNVQLHIPSIHSIEHSTCTDSQCINGQCRLYQDGSYRTAFCQCHQGWSGQHCTIQFKCTCSFGSLCIGQLANNRSICICPMNRTGPRCLLEDSICQTNSENKCLNGGTCVPLNGNQFACLCPKTHTGERCEIVQTKIIISFNKDIDVPHAIRVHGIDEVDFMPEWINTIYKGITFGQESTTIYYPHNFTTLVFEWSKNYYLPLFYRQHQQSIIIQRKIHAKDRCAHISELFNQTILNYPPIRRIKYYHVPCRTEQFAHLLCFHDETYFCMCLEHIGERIAHCIEYNHNMTYDCKGKNVCENGGECYQDHAYCPTTSLCVCSTCFYGTQCQLNTNEYSLSLDAILGYHIRPKIPISQQNAAVLVSLILSIIICFVGFINGILTFITFNQRQARDLGCGIYLFYTSLNCLFIMILFTFKVWILVFSHIGTIQNRLFLTIQCYSIDYFLRISLTIDHWLAACVAIERAYIVVKQVHLDRNKTKSIAKKIIFAIQILFLSTTIQDPLNRQLFDEINDEEKRIWCIVSYLPSVHILNSIITTIHTICPFIINFISTIIIIITSTRQRALVQKQKNYETILSEQFRQHRNLLIAPIVLIVLDIPRLIITFVPGCLKSSRDSWLFLIGYFLSLIPSLLTFILFVLPSTIYSQLFTQAIHRYRNLLRTHT